MRWRKGQGEEKGGGGKVVKDVREEWNGAREHTGPRVLPLIRTRAALTGPTANAPSEMHGRLRRSSRVGA